MWSFVIRVVAVCVRAVVAAVIEAAADVLYRSIAADLNRRFGIA